MNSYSSRILAIFEKLKQGESLDSIIDAEILEAKKDLDRSFIRNGDEDPDIQEYINELQKIRFKYE